MTNANTTTLAVANNIAVFAVSVVSATSGAVDWFADLTSANNYFDEQVKKFADIDGEMISLFTVAVPSDASKNEITALVDEVMDADAFVPLRQYVTTEVYIPMPRSALKTLIGITEGHVQDIKNGLENGTYQPSENVGLGQIEITLAHAQAAVETEDPRLEGMAFNRKLVLEAKATSNHCETPDYCEVQFSKADMAKIINLSKYCAVMGLSEVHFDFTPNSWGSEGIEERADLGIQSIVVTNDELFWVLAHADSYNCHFESEVQSVGSILAWMKEELSPVIFESDDVEERYLDNQSDEESAEEA